MARRGRDALARLLSGRCGARRPTGARAGYWLAAAAALCAFAPREASADLPGDRVDFAMYGRAGIGWTLSGQVISGKSMNLGDGRQLGGRLEEGDYLEPAVKAHILKGDHDDDTKIDMVMTLGMFAKHGSFISSLASSTSEVLGIEMSQAFIEARNLFTKDLTFWIGARQYRGADIHIADYYYFNDLSGQGAGIKYKGIDTAVLIATNGTSSFYNADLDGDDKADVQRQRTVVVGQYTYPFGPRGTFVQGLAELHVMPASRKGDGPELENENPSDLGWVAGAKVHLDLDKGAFNDTSVRYGSRIANGAAGGSSTFYTFGDPAEDGKYDSSAFGLEVVDHFLWNFNPLFSVNAYGVFNMSQGASGADQDKRLNFAVGARTFLYAHRQFHLINELTFQGRKDGDLDMGTAVKASIVPTIVPTGERSAWARPHLRLIYTAGFYNDAAADQLMSPYLQTVGRTKVGHFIGTRAEWWF